MSFPPSISLTPLFFLFSSSFLCCSLSSSLSLSLSLSLTHSLSLSLFFFFFFFFFSLSLSAPPTTNPSLATPPLYFVLLTLTCNFLLLNIIVGIIIDEYTKQKEQDMAAMSKDTRTEWLERKILQAMHPEQLMEPPSGTCWKLRTTFYNIATSYYFEYFYQLLVFLSVVVALFKTASDTPTKMIILLYIDIFFTMMFLGEILIQLMAYGIIQCMENYNTLLDFFVLICQCIYISLKVSIEFSNKKYFGSESSESDRSDRSESVGPSIFFIHLFGGMFVVRCHRLVNWSSKVQMLVNTYTYAMPHMVHVVIMWILVYFTFSVIGMNFFAGIKHGEYLNDYANFDEFYTSFATLMRCSTGEGYNMIMKDLMIAEPYCSPSVQNCGSIIAPLYFFLFFWVQAYVLMNLLVAVILDVFAETNQIAVVIENTKHHFARISQISQINGNSEERSFSNSRSTRRR